MNNETISHREFKCKMSIFNIFSRKDINDGVEQYRREDNAVLLDVRTDGEFAEGHIEGSLNLPIVEIDRAATMIPDKSVPIYVYCRSGNRSARAAAYLKGNGYPSVYDIGGILSYKGKIVK